MNKEKLRRMENVARQENWLKIFALAEKKQGGTLLDVGCGGGRHSIEFANKIGVSKIYGIDINKSCVAKAKERGMIAKRRDANKRLPFRDEFFDVVLCNQVAEHLTNPDNLFEEIHRVLKRDGYTIISVPNLCSLHNRLLILFGFHPTSISPSTKFVFGNPDRGYKIPSTLEQHVTAFSPRSLKEMLNFYELKVKKLCGGGFYPFGARVSQALSKVFPTFSVYLIVVARRERL